MTLHLSHEAFRTATGELRAALDELSRHREGIDHRVSGFLDAGWTGQAAASFVEVWADWRAASGEVVTGLEATGRLLDAVHADLTRQDADAAHALTRVAARIGQRLG